MNNSQLYKDLVEYLGLLAHVVEVSETSPEIEDLIARADYKGFITATKYQVVDLSDLLLKHDPNRMGVQTYQNWDI